MKISVYMYPWVAVTVTVLFLLVQYNMSLQQKIAMRSHTPKAVTKDALVTQLQRQGKVEEELLTKMLEMERHIHDLETKVVTHEEMQGVAKAVAQSIEHAPSEGAQKTIPGCIGIEVSGITNRPELNGAYLKMGDFGDRPMYRNSANAGLWLYYLVENKEWMLGPNFGTNQVLAFVPDEAKRPEEIKVVWKSASNTNQFVDDPSTKVICTNEDSKASAEDVARLQEQAALARSHLGDKDSGNLQMASGYPQYDTLLHFETVATKPRIYYLSNLLTPTECQELMALATPEMNKTQIIGEKGDGEVSNYRTNDGMFLNRPEHAEAPPVKAARTKIGQFLHLPPVNIEPLNVLRYASGQYYKPHTDWFPTEYPALLERGGQRVASCLTWLNEIPEGFGGETEFPAVEKKVRGKKAGDAVCWWNIDENGKEEPLSAHAAIPPEGHEKWVVVAWIRAHEFH
eukprot:TRINITY_DN67506_c6_g2_i6.p1 TRINITY_DN67506_c6_g2~~TRINITY_DN67506_c6_g2_i6.p1  ORF type:complete len:469 (-),score=56.31 TRINITY_DN67506_c6_g2_i6:217-1584(-)